MGFLVDKLLSLAEKRDKPDKRTFFLANMLAFFIFNVLLPVLLVSLGLFLSKHFGDLKLGKSHHLVNLILITSGLLLRFWAGFSFYKLGEGTPLYTLPSQRLIVKGPFRYTRNPIMLSLMLYYLGLCLFFDSMTVFFLLFIIPSLWGNIYHKFVEERELSKRFGDEYLRYRENVPFLIPLFKLKRGKSFL